MTASVSPHAMWGLKIKYANGENRLNDEEVYTIELPDGTRTRKVLNACNEFINTEIHNFLIENGYTEYPRRHPPQFNVEHNENRIRIFDRFFRSKSLE